MPEITKLMRKAAAQLFPDSPVEQEAFLEALVPASPQKRGAVIWTRPEMRREGELPLLPPPGTPSWLPPEISFLEAGETAGKSALFEAGAIYPLDVSSVYTAAVLLAVPPCRRALDVCAAPGGKSLFVAAVLKVPFILSNEVIPKRRGVLRHNLRKAGLAGRHFTQGLEPERLAELAPRSFDLVLADAPCSGQSLLVKGLDNPGCFHPNIVKGNSRRQFRILAGSARCVAPGGWLFYSTCTFAPRENEWVVEKFLAANPEFSAIEAPRLAECRSPLTSHWCYRVYPHRQPGAGGFSCLMRREGQSGELPSLADELTAYPVGE